MKYYTLIFETENAIAKFPYTDKEFATKLFEKNAKSNKFTKVELVVEEELSNKESELPF